ncbi:DUF6054 family protein [Zhenpiania hominis]|uniref:DUF6054 family protein n=1 Tax=Zhenpiania hominis TaxID=2763644 RepID=UPI0039F568CA
MSRKVIKMIGNRLKPIEELVPILIRNLSEELVLKSIRQYDDCKVGLVVMEKLYLRTGSYANLTVLLVETSKIQTAQIIGSGGGNGVFNLSWGTNSNFAESARSVLEEYGFTEQKGS